MEPTDLLTTTQAAEYLGLTRQAIIALTKRQGLGRRFGHAWLFTRAELDAWRDKPRIKGGRPPKVGAGTLPAACPA